jgi:hypothetical protein
MNIVNRLFLVVLSYSLVAQAALEELTPTQSITEAEQLKDHLIVNKLPSEAALLVWKRF